MSLSLSAFAQITDQRSGVVKEISGTIEIRHAGDNNFVPARIGDILGENTDIFAGFRSMALLQIGSALITVHPLTRLTLTEIITAHTFRNITMHVQKAIILSRTIAKDVVDSRVKNHGEFVEVINARLSPIILPVSYRLFTDAQQACELRLA